MRMCSQALDFCTCLKGYTLPQYMLYGNVNKKLYTCDVFTGRIETGKGHTWRINLWDEKHARWISTDTKKHGDIFRAIEKYVADNEIMGTKIICCKFNSQKKAEALKAAERAEKHHARVINNRRKDIMSAAPRERRPQTEYIFRGYYNGRVGSIETDKVWIDEKCPNPITSDCWEKGYMQPFEMGQETSGSLFISEDSEDMKQENKYCRSGFEIKRDGLKVDITKVRPNEKPDYMKRSGEISGISMDKLAEKRYKKALSKVNERFGSLEKALKFGVKSDLIDECLYYEHNYKK